MPFDWLENKKCPHCEKGDLYLRDCNFSYMYKGQKFSKYVRGFFCGVCNETFIHPEDEKMLNVESSKFNKRVDDELLKEK